MKSEIILGEYGSGVTETVLWTNPSPSSAWSNSSQTTITFPQSMLDFDELKVTWKASTTDATESYIKIPVSALARGADGKTRFYLSGLVSSNAYCRNITYGSNTSIVISGGIYQVNGSSTIANTNGIPLEVEGIKY